MRIFAAAILILLPALALAQAAPVEQGPRNALFEPAFPNQTRAPSLPQTPVTIEPFVTGLAHPWGIAPLPGGTWLVTERPGRLRVVTAEGVVSAPVSGLPEVDDRRQGGLLDVTVSAAFGQDNTIFWTYAKRVKGGTVTAAARGILDIATLSVTDVQDIFVQSPPSPTPMHYGSRILLDGRGHAFITTGEHSTRAERVLAQDLSTTYGKLVRIQLDGSAPSDNPFVRRDGLDTIWSFGHRNPQGAAIHPRTGALWTVEHGPAGGDELNRPEPGANYGWPVVSYGVNYNGRTVGIGEPRAERMEEPVYYWDPVIAPGGMEFYDSSTFAGWRGDLLIGSLNPGGLVRLKMQGGRVIGEERVVNDQGRVRDVEVAPDGSVLLLIDAPAPNGGIVRLRPAG